ncbi:MAG TPA: N-acetylmuramoyl-L-alanine amidase [Cryomorphaceae bacterium]|nr:hypothetical protein [Owenweeksia sp.]HBF19208.1 N-acetylmuramoyl-L-alanine amidase [Cryomorphaceae bacterium]HCQ15093.1 N-acetylmuramoyl-L-alanine amidase [Cryomorphaceae bacterium]
MVMSFTSVPGGGGVKVVVIDAGHGGHDPGNLGTRRYKTREKDIALAVALKVGNYIQQNLPDVKVVYTRKTDVFIELQERARIANAADADLFISIHCDAFTQKSVSGATSLVLGRNHGDENMRVAQQENSVILLEDNYEEKYEGFDPRKPETFIALTLYQNAFLNQSISFAQKVQDQFRERVKRKDRGVKQQPLYVTSRTAMPAVLVELGFLTNYDEEDFLNSEQGQDFMASAIFRAFKEYKDEREFFENSSVPHAPTPDPTKKEETPTQAQLDPVKQPEEKPHEVYYTVQILTSGIKKNLKPENFKGVSGVEIYEEGKLFKYIVGKTPSLGEAETLKQKMKDAGFKDAFVIALSDGTRISLEEAKELLQ